MIIALLVLILLAIIDPMFTARLIGLGLLIALVCAVIGGIALAIGIIM